MHIALHFREALCRLVGVHRKVNGHRGYLFDATQIDGTFARLIREARASLSEAGDITMSRCRMADM